MWERDGDVGKRREKSRKVQEFKATPPTPTHASKRSTQKCSSSPSIHPPRSAFLLFCLSEETSFVITRNAPQFRQLLRSSTTAQRESFSDESRNSGTLCWRLLRVRVTFHSIQSQSIDIKVDYEFMRRNFIQPPHVLSFFPFPLLLPHCSLFIYCPRRNHSQIDVNFHPSQQTMWHWKFIRNTQRSARKKSQI